MANFAGIRNRSGQIVQPPGDEVITKFNFAFNTPGLTTGLTVFTPTAGDILVDCWLEIDTAFNGTTPKVDVGDFVSANTGWFAQAASALDATVADATATSGPLLVDQMTNSGHNSSLRAAGDTNSKDRSLPGKFANANPVKLVLTQNGQKGGVATGATQGAGTVFFLTGTPA